jgi:hypothetical protein
MALMSAPGWAKKHEREETGENNSARTDPASVDGQTQAPVVLGQMLAEAERIPEGSRQDRWRG